MGELFLNLRWGLGARSRKSRPEAAAAVPRHGSVASTKSAMTQATSAGGLLTEQSCAVVGRARVPTAEPWERPVTTVDERSVAIRHNGIFEEAGRD